MYYVTKESEIFINASIEGRYRLPDSLPVSFWYEDIDNPIVTETWDIYEGLITRETYPEVHAEATATNLHFSPGMDIDLEAYFIKYPPEFYPQKIEYVYGLVEYKGDKHIVFWTVHANPEKRQMSLTLEHFTNGYTIYGSMIQEKAKKLEKLQKEYDRKPTTELFRKIEECKRVIGVWQCVYNYAYEHGVAV